MTNTTEQEFMNPVNRYSFNLPWPAVILGAAFYAGLAAYMFYLARDFAGVIFDCLIALSVVFGIFGVIMLARRLLFSRMLELTDEAILYPRGFPKTRIIIVPYADILRIVNHGEGDQTVLTAVTGRGTFAITASYFKKVENYHAVKDFISTKSSIAMPRNDRRESPKETLNKAEFSNFN